MIVISDSNLLISALYNPNGAIAEILTSKSNIQISAPEFILTEVNNHFSDLLKYTGKTKLQITQDLKQLTSKITFYKSSEIEKKYLKEAFEIVKDIDPDDFFFIALHLQIRHKIWTGDIHLIKGLLKKGYDICVTTEELKKFLYKKD
ncbi:PIN domain-containing protein [Moheibacter sp.]|uniref:PIN domain-containing protein n=1 Tax=Moheibacter sp. TaxID=1965316 RepID=UPI003C724283